MAHDKQLKGWPRLLTEFGPLLIFFASFKIGGIMVATGAFMVAITVSIAINWHLARHVPVMLWITFAIVMIMGGLTLWLEDETFVKMKPTLIFGLFGTVLAIGLVRGRLFLKTLLDHALPDLEDQYWRLMTQQWIGFYLSMSVINEAIWRTQSLDTWVNVKTFGYMPVTLVFTAIQMLYIFKKAGIDITEDGDEEPS